MPVLGIWRRVSGAAAGRWLFSNAVALRAPYFRTVRPRVLTLERGRAEVTARNRWGVHNHIGTFHAIACCNLAEVAAGLVMEVSLPPSHRWIPKGMTVSYLAKAGTDLRAVGTVHDLRGLGAAESAEAVVAVDVLDTHGSTVVRADITMWLTPRTG